MSESIQHQKLVKLILEYTENLVGFDKSCFISSDVADGLSIPPLTAEGYRPDVFYLYDEVMIIGEAKTSDDVRRIHSCAQYESYIKKCSLFSGYAYFVVSVHWSDKASISNILNRIKKKYAGEYKIVILEGY